MEKRNKTLLKIAAGLVCYCTMSLSYAGFTYGWGPFAKLHNIKLKSHPGNHKKYSSSQLEYLSGTRFEGKRVLFLGSSVTYGANSLQDGIPEYFAKRFGAIITKEAISGTTLTDLSLTSYVSRLKKYKKNAGFDYLVCQLSTNDASKNLELGVISDSKDINSFRTDTITGAMEFIIAYAREQWNCDVYFYTGSWYESENYDAMVQRLYELRDKWGIGIFDLWRNEAFNHISEEERKLYMSDPIHPTRAGYMGWWCPEIERLILK